MPRPRGRAATQDDKRAIVERILRAWQACPQLRLGQFLDNAMSDRGADGPVMFYAEDESLALVAELYASRARV